MMKKSILLLLVFSMVLSAFLMGCSPKEEPTDTPPTDEPGDEPGDEVTGPPSEPMGQIIVGNTTEMSGDWVPYWQNIASEYDIYNFITDYPTVAMTFDGEYLINDTVVASHEVIENEDGSKTYEYTIKDGLVWDDGTPITAKDYVATVLLWSSNVVKEMGAGNTYGQRYVGYKAYGDGEAKEFEGVRLLDDMKFSVTIDAAYLPYYFELGLVSVSPTKISFWTDDTVEVLDDGNGAYFSDNFTKENFEENIDKARSAIPRPSCGPYVLKSFDESTKTAVLEVNDKYVGDHNGQKPLIKTVIYKLVNEETQMDELATGSVDLLLGMASGSEINAGLDLVESGGFNFTKYPRAGYGKLAFVGDFGPTQFVEVRQAIAHLLDRNEFARSFTEGFGSVVNGPYGEALWFYQETKAELNEKLNQYPYSLEKAIELLEDGGWVYDENGNEYESGIRYKKLDDGTLMPLVIQWSSSGNEVSELLTIQLVENPDLAAAGMKIEETVMDFPELVNYLERNSIEDPKYGVPTYGMFNLASNFNPIYDQSNYYEPGHPWNTSYSTDEKLDELAKAIVLTDPEDREGFKQKFVDFIVRWNELLPELPLYSNIYHDFYNDKLVDYDMNALIRVSDALLYAYVTE